MHRKEHYSRPNLVPVVAGAVIGYPHGPQLPVSPDGAGVRAQAGRESCADDSPVEVLLKSGVKILATLDEADQEGLTLSYEEKQAVEGKKRKQTVRVTRRYPFSEIKYTKEYLDFK